jgi:hypothetical protein
MTPGRSSTETQDQLRRLTEEELQIVAGGTQTAQFRGRYQLRLDEARALLG